MSDFNTFLVKIIEETKGLYLAEETKTQLHYQVERPFNAGDIEKASSNFVEILYALRNHEGKLHILPKGVL